MKLKNTNVKLLVYFLGFISLILLPIVTNAQTSSRANSKLGQGITMSPVTFELTADPGDVLSNVIKVTNPGGSSIGIKMEVEDFVAIGESGRVAVLESKNETYSLKKWITTSPGYFTLGPDEVKIINFTINVPKNAEPGGHYASVLSVVTADTSAGSGSAISQKLGALVLLSVSGEIKEDLLIKEFSAPKFSEKGPIPFTIRFENTGSIHVRPKGFVSISDMRGKKLKDIAFPQKNILPSAKRKIDVKWEGSFLLGKYKAYLVGSYGTNKQIYAVTSFWVIPWKMILGILAGALSLIFILYKARRRLRLAFKALIKGQ